METHATTPVPAQTLQNVSPPWKRRVQRGFSELPKVVLMSIRIGTPVFKDATDAPSHFCFWASTAVPRKTRPTNAVIKSHQAGNYHNIPMAQRQHRKVTSATGKQHISSTCGEFNEDRKRYERGEQGPLCSLARPRAHFLSFSHSFLFFLFLPPSFAFLTLRPPDCNINRVGRLQQVRAPISSNFRSHKSPPIYLNARITTTS